MSQFFGCLAKNTTNLSLQKVKQSMQQAVNYFTPNATDCFEQEDNFFVVNKFLHNSVFPNPTAIVQNQQYVIAASVRLYNRPELQTLDCFRLLDLNLLSDHQVLLHLYSYYKKDCLQFLVGDFSFIVWDKANQSLFLAKDQLGIKPLFYLQQPNALYFATDINAINAVFDYTLAANEEYLAYELKNYPVPVHLTPIQEVYRLKPAHAAIISIEKFNVTEKKYWELSKTNISHLRTDEEKLQAVRTLFEKAVKDRMLTPKNIGSQLSGGMDSSAITVLAAKHTDKQKLHTYSFVLNKETEAYSDKKIDEKNTQQAIIDYAQLLIDNHHPVEKFHYKNYQEQLEERFKISGGYSSSDSFWQHSLFKAQAQHNIGVSFSGFPGDECISNSGVNYYFDYLYNVDVVNLFYFLKKHRKKGIKKIIQYFKALTKGSLWSNYAVIQQKRNYLHPNSKWQKLIKDQSFRFYPSFKKYLKNNICKAHTCLRCESETAYALPYGVEPVYPLADIRLLELVYSLPPHLFKPEGKYDRMLFRNICKPFLPNLVRMQPKANGAFTLAFAEYAVRKTAEDIIEKNIQVFESQLIKKTSIYNLDAIEDLIFKIRAFEVNYFFKKTDKKFVK